VKNATDNNAECFPWTVFGRGLVPRLGPVIDCDSLRFSVYPGRCRDSIFDRQGPLPVRVFSIRYNLKQTTEPEVLKFSLHTRF